ncbi:MAG: hypothetical protein V7711_19050 [Pseudomonadales bacterium]
MIPKLSALILFLMLAGCSTTDYDPYVVATENQVQTRNYQTRDFEQVEYKLLVQAVVSTLQDYHFRIRELDMELGVLTAYQQTAYDNKSKVGGRTELTVFVKSREKGSYAVRVNMSTGRTVENAPQLYQQFFAALRKKLDYHGSV